MKVSKFSTANIFEKCWEAAMDNLQKNKLKIVLESQFVLFFKYKNEIFGASEGSRVTFAKMKDPKDEDYNKDWLSQSSFIAINLNRLAKGEQNQIVFTYKELPEVKVINKEEAEKELSKIINKD